MLWGILMTQICFGWADLDCINLQHAFWCISLCLKTFITVTLWPVTGRAVLRAFRKTVSQVMIHRLVQIKFSITFLKNVSLLVMSDSLQPHGLGPTRLLCSWNSPGKNNGVGCHLLPQGIFPTQGLNLGLLHCRQILYHLSHQGNPSFSFLD